MIVLGIESSCDETAAALVNDKKEILGEALLSQEEHKAFGGVVPEIAARSHLDHIDGILEQCFAKTGLTLKDIDAVAAASGPGLIGGVVVGVMTAKALSVALDKPFVAVNHLEGHALAARISNDVTFPYLLLLVSGGHCQILVVKDVGQYERLGTTIDDAVGEAFDKVAKMLGRNFIGIERDAHYVAGAQKRIDNTQCVSDDCLEFSAKKRQPRVPFGAVVERGLLKAGDKLYDASRKHCALIRSDGTLKASFGEGSIHQVGAAAQNAPACNGWVYWHFEDKDKGLVSIDELRKVVRVEMYGE